MFQWKSGEPDFNALDATKFLFEGTLLGSVFASVDFTKAWFFRKTTVVANTYTCQKVFSNLVTSLTSPPVLEVQPEPWPPEESPSRGYLAQDTKLERGLFCMKEGEARGLFVFGEMLGVAC